MEDNNDKNGEGENKPQENQPQFAKDALPIPGQVHNLPIHQEKWLPKFDLETYELPEDQIKKFILAIRLMKVKHKYVEGFFLIPLKIHPRLGISTWQLVP
jgi:hypothetical protein